MGKQISLTKYGFVHNHNRDFSDDGTRFEVYELPDNPYIKATKASYGGKVFVSINYRRGRLTKYIDRLNGVDRNRAADALPAVMKMVIEEWIPACEKEYVEFRNKRIREIDNSIISLQMEKQMYADEIKKEAEV